MLRRNLVKVLVAAGLLLAWELAARAFEPSWLPTVSATAVEWWELAREGELSVLASTGQTLAIGLLIVLVVSAVVAPAMAASRLVTDTLNPFLSAVLATPTVALIPAIILLFGFSNTTRVATVVSFALAPTIVTWAEALRDVPGDLMEMARGFSAPRRRQLRSVVLPAAAPLLLTGVRIAVVQGIKGVVSAEVLIGVIGVGRLIQESNLSFNLPRLYAVIFTLLALSIAAYTILEQFERRASRRWTND